MVKTYILDTNIILNDPYAMVDGFEDNTVVITSTTLQELDVKKKAGGETGYNARLCGKILDDLRQKGDLISGIKNDSGGITKIEPDGVNKDYLPVGYALDSADNRIISTCIHIKKNLKDTKMPVILVTNDILARVSATAAFSYAGADIGVEGYENSHIDDKDTLYKGYREIDVSGADKDIIGILYNDRKADLKDVIDMRTPVIADQPVENEFFTFRNGSASAMSVFQNHEFHLIDPDQSLCGWIKPKNELQAYAIWLLKNKNIPLKILIGNPGTGKTFLSLAAGLDDTIGKKKYGAYYDRMLISRPVFGYEEIGFLPGTVDEKLNSSLNLNYLDNLETILRRGGQEDRDQIKMQVQDMFETDTIEVCALSFIRGRSLIGSYLICDEAQNANPTLIRDVCSRAGAGSSIVIAGDPRQVDISNLDSHNNGIEYAASRMKGSSLCGIIRFPAEASVRSPLAKAVSERM